MTQEDKELLLKYLCMALPYGVKVYCGEDWAMTLKQIDYNCFCECWENEDIKSHSRWKLPYLRTLASMTEEERNEYNEYLFYGASIGLMSNTATAYELIDWLLKNHFDFIGLIPKNLAIEVTEDSNPYKE